jgi:uncharacterized integral membrane protein (TIGR00698 family)
MTDIGQADDTRFGRLSGPALKYGPGVLVCGTVGLAAQFLSDHYGAPATLMALLLGIAFHFLSEEGRCVPGIGFSAKTVLRIGVALLGARMSGDLLVSVGGATIALLVIAVAATILFGLIAARLLGRGWRIALLTGGSVAICGASAAIAIAAVLPKNEFSERNLTFTVLSVTVLSTVAMVAYPIVCSMLGFDHRASGVFLGATIHDVAQVVGAGFTISDDTGQLATLIKLIRVTLLAPVVLIYSVALRGVPQGEAGAAKRPPILPGFIIGFLALFALNSAGFLPKMAVSGLSDISRWLLLFGISAVGMRTSLKSMGKVGHTAIILIVAETLFIALFVVGGLALIH